MSEEEVREAAEEKPARRAAKPVKEMPKIRPGTVKGKIAAIQKAVAEIDSGARAIQAKFSEQMKENQEAVAKIQLGVRAIQSAIRDHMKKHQAAVADMQSAISEQMKENQSYVRDFYG